MAFKIFDQLAVGVLRCNCYLAGDEETGEAIVIDPGDQPGDILAAAARLDLKLVAAVATHGHFDHVLGADMLRQRTGIPFYLHSSDQPILDRMQERGLQLLGLELPAPPEVDRYLADGDGLTAGSVGFEVLYTPGHSPGSVSLVVGGQAVFSGDTLFAGSVGRTDTPGGDFERELSSIRGRLFLLEDLAVYPGHGPATSIGREKAENPFVGASARIWAP